VLGTGEGEKKDRFEKESWGGGIVGWGGAWQMRMSHGGGVL